MVRYEPERVCREGQLQEFLHGIGGPCEPLKLPQQRAVVWCEDLVPSSSATSQDPGSPVVSGSTPGRGSF